MRKRERWKRLRKINTSFLLFLLFLASEIYTESLAAVLSIFQCCKWRDFCLPEKIAHTLAQPTTHTHMHAHTHAHAIAIVNYFYTLLLWFLA